MVSYGLIDESKRGLSTFTGCTWQKNLPLVAVSSQHHLQRVSDVAQVYIRLCSQFSYQVLGSPESLLHFHIVVYQLLQAALTMFRKWCSCLIVKVTRNTGASRIGHRMVVSRLGTRTAGVPAVIAALLCTNGSSFGSGKYAVRYLERQS